MITFPWMHVNATFEVSTEELSKEEVIQHKTEHATVSVNYLDIRLKVIVKGEQHFLVTKLHVLTNSEKVRRDMTDSTRERLRNASLDGAVFSQNPHKSCNPFLSQFANLIIT